MATAVTVAFIGSVASILGVLAVARDDGGKARQASATTAVEIASTLKLALRREQDLAVDAGAFVIGNPSGSQAQFQRWEVSDQVFERYPELQGIGELVLVPESDLASFAAHALADPIDRRATAGAFRVTPPGLRPYYCFQSLSQSRSGEPATPADLDLCDTGFGPVLFKARDSGIGVYLPYGVGNQASLGVGTAIYRGGTAPPTVQARRAAFMGWVGIEVKPSVVLATALDGHANTAVSFRHGVGASSVTFDAGRAPAGATATTVRLPNGWHVQVSAVAGSSGVIGNPNAVVLLVSGILLSLLLGLLIYVLGTGRSRALQLVHERTGQLSHQALHDSLTGLPNRTLILDRIEGMLARGRRNHTPVAALFLDLDNFKDINDTLGHRAGDELLVGVAARLASVLRAGETVGRLGGDEFVVLTEMHRGRQGLRWWPPGSSTCWPPHS